jgi:arylsulfatase A-like enzyme
LLTGKSPWNHGLLGAYLTVNCEEYPTTLPEILDGMGYKTSIVGKNHFGVNTTSGAFISQGYREMNIYDGSLRLTSEVPDDYYKWFYEVVPGVDPLATCSDIFEDGLQWQVVCSS